MISLSVKNLVELKWVTPNAEEMIVEQARVSNPDNANNMETAPRLLRYLIKHKHWSPFQMASMGVTIHTERDISAQILRHKSFEFQEYSSRYAKMPSYTLPSYRRQDDKNRQNDLSDEVHDALLERTTYLLDQVFAFYDEMLEIGIAKETARRILPLCTSTTLHMTGTLRSWIHYLQVRCDPATQLEHRQIACAIRDIFIKEFPVIGQAVFPEATYTPSNSTMFF
jgi:thymidylate synthase (FAD)